MLGLSDPPINQNHLMPKHQEIHVIDSHTGGEPTRIIVDGAPDLGSGTLAEQRSRFQQDYDWLRSAAVNEPRGSDAVVGALLTTSPNPDADIGVIFFNNTGYLNMCVHGTIGLAVTLAWMGRLNPGEIANIDTPVGMVQAHLHEDGTHVSVANVPSYRSHTDIKLDVDGYGEVTADVAWGGNWFLLVNEHSLEVSYENIATLTDFGVKAREALERDKITGDDGGEIDHIEVFVPVTNGSADSRNFVLCPGEAYDRSPCGTGTSAKLACLYDAGKLAEGQVWRQASVLGSVFEGTVKLDGDQKIIPHVTGDAYVNSEAKLILQEDDPFGCGITASTIS
mgnify:CR=1 FL=1